MREKERRKVKRASALRVQHMYYLLKDSLFSCASDDLILILESIMHENVLTEPAFECLEFAQFIFFYLFCEYSMKDWLYPSLQTRLKY